MRIVEDLDLLKEGLGPASLVIALGLSGTAATALKLGCAALGLLTIIRVFKMPESTVIRLGALVSGGFLCSPYAMRYEAVLLQPIAVALLLERKAHPATWLAPFLCFTTLFLWAAPVLMGLTILFMTRAKQDSRHVMTPALDAPSSELQRQTQGAG